MRIVNANGTLSIVTDIEAADLKSIKKAYDAKGNEVYAIAKGEKGCLNKCSAVLNGVVDGKAAYIMVTPEGFDYDKFKTENAASMAAFKQAHDAIVAGIAAEKDFVSKMWAELEESGTVNLTPATPSVPAEE